MNTKLFDQAVIMFVSEFGAAHSAAAHAPGRVEVLGNHTDYNEGFVLSVAINHGTFFLARRSGSPACRLMAGDIREMASFNIYEIKPYSSLHWSNYVKGVFAQLRDRFDLREGFDGLFLGDVPLGAGLSSSAALEISAGMAFAHLYGLEVPAIEMAKIGQKAEHLFVGAKCGLLDQITSLFGDAAALVMTDFRSLQTEMVPLGPKWRFLVVNTGVKHSLVDSEYNERRARCEEAAKFFARRLAKPVRALRDVTLSEFEAHRAAMDAVTAKRAAHVIGENTRVVAGRQLLAEGKVREFGQLMFESHASSRYNFENSCTELDHVVDTAKNISEVLGGRLSGGGFGGGAVLLVPPSAVESITAAVTSAYQQRFGHACNVLQITPAEGARIL